MVRARKLRCVTGALLLIGVASAIPGVYGQAPKPAAPGKPAVGVVELTLWDGSVLKARVPESNVIITTPYGKLTVPLADVRGLELAPRIPEDVRKKIDKAVADLGDSDFRVREAASAELTSLGPRAYPALVQARKSTDAEVRYRTEAILDKLKGKVPAVPPKVRKDDLLTTEDFKIVGQVEDATLRFEVLEGGHREVKWSDLRVLRSATTKPVAKVEVLPDPGDVDERAHQIGKVFYFRVTGEDKGYLWGSDVYTTDSPIATAAVHAGILKVGETGVVKVMIVLPRLNFQGTTRNGVTAEPYGPWGAYTVEKVEEESLP